MKRQTSLLPKVQHLAGLGTAIGQSCGTSCTERVRVDYVLQIFGHVLNLVTRTVIIP